MNLRRERMPILRIVARRSDLHFEVIRTGAYGFVAPGVIEFRPSLRRRLEPWAGAEFFARIGGTPYHVQGTGAIAHSLFLARQRDHQQLVDDGVQTCLPYPWKACTVGTFMACECCARKQGLVDRVCAQVLDEIGNDGQF